MKSKSLILFAGSLLFLTAGVLSSFIFSKRSSPQLIAQKLSLNLEGELSIIDENAELLLDRFSKQANREILTRSEYPFLVYNAQQVVSWSDNRFVPS